MVKSVLFACNMNSVRSPIAAALLRAAAKGRIRVDSAGVYEGGLDPFVERVLAEIGVSIEGHEPKSMRSIDPSKFDLVVALTPEAVEEARRFLPDEKVEYWPTDNPSEARGGSEEVLAAYRRTREMLRERIAERFPENDQNP